MEAATHGTGVYFDGVSGRRQTVTVDLTDDAIAIGTPEGAAIARWPYADVIRVAAAGGRLRLGHSGNGPPARLAIPDTVFANAVADRLGVLAPQLEAKERRKRHRVVEWSIAAVAALVVLAAVGMPPIAELLAPLVSAEAEDAIGRTVDEASRTGFDGPDSFECGLADGEREGHAAFLKLIGKLEAAAGLPVRLRPVVVRAPKTINAMAGPGGYVYVYYGIIRFVDTPDELAGILAHELGHVAHRDTVKGLLSDTGAAYLFGVLMGDFFGSGAMFYSAGKILHAHYSRPQEAAADAYSVPLVAKAGGDPYGAAVFFEHASREFGPNQLELFDEHPTHGARIAAIRAIPAQANRTPLLTPTEWKALKQVCADKKASN
jgi:Zn-dependent protease with chaperone function